MTETIRIGGDVPANRPATRPLTYLPARLDEQACLQVLAAIDPEVQVDSVSAARGTINVARLDSALEYTALSISDRFRLKAAMAQHGILSLGRKV
jgi:hypothetical protein